MMSHFATIFTFVFGILAFTNAQLTITANTCAGGTGTAFFPNATNCQDQSPGCATIFTAPTDLTDVANRDTKCADAPEIALQCAQTCGICCATPEFNCGDNPLSTVNCQANANKCRDPDWVAVMNEYCSGTCGTCLSGSTCRDIINGCSDMRGLCLTTGQLGDYVRENCRRSCILCSTTTTATTTPTPGVVTPTCSDIATNCVTNAALCNNSQYYTLMTQKCPRTCNRCSASSSGSTSCTDSSANCANWVANGFCRSTFYTTEQKRQYCGRSCNLC